MRVALRPLRRADSPLQEAHRGEALPVRRLQPLLLPLRSPGPAHEETPELKRNKQQQQQKQKPFPAKSTIEIFFLSSSFFSRTGTSISTITNCGFIFFLSLSLSFFQRSDTLVAVLAHTEYFFLLL